MKKIISLITLIIAITTVNAQTIRITGTRFIYPIFRKWATEYSATHPNVKIIVAAGIPVDSTDIQIAAHILKPGDVKEGQTSVALTRYVQLPIVNSERSDLKALTDKGFSEATFRQIYFSDAPAATASPFTVYRRDKAACSSVAFSNHFGNEHKDIKGIGVKGDDQDLLESVKKDRNAVSHNNLGLIYNINTRKINDSIAIVPIDLNENGKIDPNEKIYNTVDEVIAFVEKTKSNKIPTENVNVIFRKTDNKAVNDFLQWVITNGQQYNHKYGLLTLEDATVKTEQQQLANK